MTAYGYPFICTVLFLGIVLIGMAVCLGGCLRGRRRGNSGWCCCSGGNGKKDDGRIAGE